MSFTNTRFNASSVKISGYSFSEYHKLAKYNPIELAGNSVPPAVISSSFSIYDSADSQRLLAMVVRDLDLDPKRFARIGVEAV